LNRAYDSIVGLMPGVSKEIVRLTYGARPSLKTPGAKKADYKI